jgi:hypothetical protein
MQLMAEHCFAADHTTMALGSAAARKPETKFSAWHIDETFGALSSA